MFWSTQTPNAGFAFRAACNAALVSGRVGERRRGEVRLDALHLGGRQGQRAVADARPLLLDHALDLFGASFVDEDLDARLVFVVAAAEQIVHAKRGFGVRQQVLDRDEVVDLVRDHRRAAEAAADVIREADVARRVAHGVEADVVNLDRGAIALGAGDGDLELARQEDELRVQRRPLAENFRVGARVHRLVARRAGEMIGGDVADAVARSLDGVHLDRGEIGEDIREYPSAPAS